MSSTLIHNARLIDSDRDVPCGWVSVVDDFIDDLGEGEFTADKSRFDNVIDAEGKFLLPGVIDEHVHFREPGFTRKGDIDSESRAAAAGGVTTFFDMPNTVPPTVDLASWEEKMVIASEHSYVNYAFFIGATTGNIGFLKSAPYESIPGIKLFMGATTASAATDDMAYLDRLFSETSARIAVHAEDETIIVRNREWLEREFSGSRMPIEFHPLIRSREACLSATKKIVDIALRHRHPLHVMHVSTAEECDFLAELSAKENLVTSETCPQYLLFASSFYEAKGSLIKCNPAVKSISDRTRLTEAVFDGTIDVIATDHAPHLPDDKKGDVNKAASGMPGVQFSLPLMFDLFHSFSKPFSMLSAKMSGNPAVIWNIDRRGFLRKGYYADLTMIACFSEKVYDNSMVLSKCGWTPYEGLPCHYVVEKTWSNGTLVFDNVTGEFNRSARAVKFNI
ncbi:MAG: amidohydrolase family protein [Muribaculaceae bacterium]|nr:amidohydrolase family protein [Muribaculaceae bacterium]